MSVWITDTAMTGDATRHAARRLVDEGGWVVSWLSGRVLTRNEVVTAMVLAETVATEQNPDCGSPMWLYLDSLAAELGLSGPDAVARASEPEVAAYTSGPDVASGGEQW